MEQKRYSCYKSKSLLKFEHYLFAVTWYKMMYMYFIQNDEVSDAPEDSQDDGIDLNEGM